MRDYRRFACNILVILVISGCMPQHISPPVGDHTEVPSMQPLADPGINKQPATVFGSDEEYSGSPLDEVGKLGLFETHGPESNQFALLKNGDESFAVRAQLLEQAKKSIRIQALIFAGDESGLYLAEILKRKKAEGLDVRIIVDATANLGLQTQWMYFDLKQHGIEVQGYESLYLEWLNEVPIPFLSPAKDPEAPNSRYHEKMWIVDGETESRVAVVGGLNIANEYFRVDPSEPSDYWRDQDIVVKGNIVSDMVTAFERNYQHFVDIKESRGILDTDHYWQATQDFLDTVGKLNIPYVKDSDLKERVLQMAQVKPDLRFMNARGRFFQNRPRLGESFIQQAYMKLFENAQREIIICNAYFIPSAEFINAVRDVVSRGVHVIILTNSPETNDLPELTMVGRNYYKYILAINEEDAARTSGGNVQIWEWYGWRYDEERQTEGTIHAKYAVFDRRYSLVGSYNLDPRSEQLNSETAVVFESKELSTSLAKIFYENDLAFSRKVSSEAAAEFNEPTDALYKLRKDFGSLFEPML